MTTPSAERPTTRIANLDGLRALSIVLVFCFHARLFGLTGGFIGVSVFFTLSGYLLARLLLTKPLNLAAIRRYWSGRARRILPASLAVLLAVITYEWIAGDAPVDAARRTWLTAAGLGNWLQVWNGGSYAALFEQPDKLVHYWSLGVEEQLYLVLPAILLACMLLRHWRWRLAVIGSLAAASFAAPFIFGFDVARTYYGSDTRAGELLAGVFLAMVHLRSQQAATSASPSLLAPTGQRRYSLLAGASIVGVIAVAFVIQPADEVIRNGLLPVLAVLSVGMLHGVVRSPELFGGVLESWPLRKLGELSYTVYLLHWPLIVILQSHGLPTAVVALGAALGSVLLSLPLERFIERPIRHRRTTTGLRLVVLGAALASIAVVVVVTKPAADAQFLADLEREAARTDLTQPAPSSIVTPTATPTAAPTTASGSTGPAVSTSSTIAQTSTTIPAPPRVAIFGDSAALSLALVVAGHVPATAITYVPGSTMLGCGIVHELEPERCAVVPQQWDDALAAAPTDIAMVMSCQWDLVERDIDGSGTVAVGNPAMNAILADAYRDAMQRLLDHGAQRVVWVLCPDFSSSVGWPVEAELQRSRDPQRVAALNDVSRSVADQFGDTVVTLDLHTWMQGRTDDPLLRPDGSHFAYEERTELADALPELLAAALRNG